MIKKQYLILALLITLFGIFVYLGNIPEEVVPEVMASEINLLPTKYDSAGLDFDTEFTIEADVNLDPESIAKYLTVEPNFTFTVQKNGEDWKKVVIIPKEPLEPQKVYKFSLDLEGRPLKWAFQTKGDFEVISTLPRIDLPVFPLIPA